MCVMSMIMDHYQDRWTPQPWQVPKFPQSPQPYYPNVIPAQSEEDIKRQQEQMKKLVEQLGKGQQVVPVPAITKEEIEEFRRLLERAREYDKRNNEPHCEDGVKKAALKTLAEAAGFNIDFVDDDGA